ncbi:MULTISPECIES: single-stranded DNA-binding protein [unclassified Novosphingobium]|nr:MULTISPECIES: single-stranded DNA-binding protein [unclassified Novosphingobium]MBB3356229.1 single-stranded DNA-binding protein [Novosphingobium sp. BK256]MBB3376996.1 single-stranded DNA-binding protein [Novosphingobium sp. BK258]MBB3419591.1 single-stranded DNA-binding protein [Novosphingobium sp. BK267]MBB3500073.1 single-stranded DNA-binding protein [Novosphingobium sp. BK336]MBB3535857.1 single-stranded DNA-binding protein [Novosphingobium sp. BK486]
MPVLRLRETPATPLLPAVLPACGRRPHHRGGRHVSLALQSKAGASFTLVTSRAVIKDGQMVNGEDGCPETYDQFHTVKAFGTLGNTVANHRKKGDKLIVQGEIRYRRSEQDGRTYYNTEIVADEIAFL